MKKPAASRSRKVAAAPLQEATAKLSPADMEAAERLIAANTRHSRQAEGSAATSRRPFFLRRGPMENLATALIAIGFLMMFQPFALPLYTWSFITMLAGTLMFVIVSKFPE